MKKKYGFMFSRLIVLPASIVTLFIQQFVFSISITLIFLLFAMLGLLGNRLQDTKLSIVIALTIFSFAIGASSVLFSQPEFEFLINMIILLIFFNVSELVRKDTGWRLPILEVLERLDPNK